MKHIICKDCRAWGCLRIIFLNQEHTYNKTQLTMGNTRITSILPQWNSPKHIFNKQRHQNTNPPCYTPYLYQIWRLQLDNGYCVHNISRLYWLGNLRILYVLWKVQCFVWSYRRFGLISYLYSGILINTYTADPVYWQKHDKSIGYSGYIWVWCYIEYIAFRLWYTFILDKT